MKHSSVPAVCVEVVHGPQGLVALLHLVDGGQHEGIGFKSHYPAL